MVLLEWWNPVEYRDIVLVRCVGPAVHRHNKYSSYYVYGAVL